jgi:N-acetylmuramoyl-L-alanine amidase
MGPVSKGSAKPKKRLTTTAWILLIIVCFVATAIPTKPETPVFSYGVANMVIVIDPGHGGIDLGATREDVIEETINLEIGQKLANYLSQAGAIVIMLRGNDSDLAGDEFTGTIRERKQKDMATRMQKANEAGADLFISIHTNAVPSPGWSGAQAFYNPNSEKSKLIAGLIQEELKRVLKNTNRTAGAGNYYVLKNSTMPAVLVEVGFLSNPREAQLLTDNEYQLKVAYAIFAGIARAQIEQNEA